jgi:hypothetical protein
MTVSELMKKGIDHNADKNADSGKYHQVFSAVSINKFKHGVGFL